MSGQKLAKLTDQVVDVVKRSIINAKPTLNICWQYARVELAPPKISELSTARRNFASLISAAKAGRYKEVTVREAVINSLVFLEIYGWFFVGECIGKRHLIGYDV